MKTLKDTIPDMLSKDFKRRLIAERDQLEIRLKSLEIALGKIPPQSRLFDLLWVQRRYMMDYLAILNQRVREVTDKQN